MMPEGNGPVAETVRPPETMGDYFEWMAQRLTCNQMEAELESATQYLHENWDQIPPDARDDLEKAVGNLLKAYKNNG